MRLCWDDGGVVSRGHPRKTPAGWDSEAIGQHDERKIRDDAGESQTDGISRSAFARCCHWLTTCGRHDGYDWSKHGTADGTCSMEWRGLSFFSLPVLFPLAPLAISK